MIRKFIVLAGLGAIAACGDGGPQRTVSNDPFCQQVIPAVEAYMAEARAANPVPDDPRYGGTVVVGGIGELADGMNAAAVGAYEAVQHIQFVNLMTLLDYDENAAPRPYLAESWDVADDNSSVTFHIRQDVRWHDGEQTDAHDVAFTYLAVTDPLTAFPNASYWDNYVLGEDGVEVLDDFTVRIYMRPHSEFLDPFRALGILPEHLLGAVPRDQLKQHPYGTQCPVGNGPFVFWSHAAQDRWVFEANPGFPTGLGGRPFVDRYVYRVIPEQTTLLTELLTEGIDVYIMPGFDQTQNIVDSPDLRLLEYPSRTFVFVAWNGRRPQLADPRVRRAITMATDREGIVDALLQGFGRVTNSTVPAVHWAFDENLESPVGYAPADARRLLDEAGWIDRDGDGVRENADGLPLEISIKYNDGNQQRQAIAEIMQSQLSEVGVAVTPQVVEFTTLIEQIMTPDVRDFDGVVLGLTAEYRLDDTGLFHSDRIDERFAFSGTSNPEMDELIETLSVTVDRDEAKGLWARYQQVLMEEQPFTFFYTSQRLDGVNNRVQNVRMDARGEWLNIREWYIDPDSR